MSLGSSYSQHKELGSTRVERDNNNFLEILTWFCNHNPFITSENLLCLDSEFIDENNAVNCDKAELIGAHIQKSLNNQIFASCSFKRKDQITNLRSLYSSIMVDKEQVVIDPLTLSTTSCFKLIENQKQKLKIAFIMNWLRIQQHFSKMV